MENNNTHKPDLDPSHELPSPHDMELKPPYDMELPSPHDMQLKPHLTHRHTWLHWLPALVGLFIGVCVGIFFTKDATVYRQQVNDFYSVTQIPTQIQTSTITPSTIISLTPQASESAVFCTTEAKICPDGSWVGRAGPRCEFLPCNLNRP